MGRHYGMDWLRIGAFGLLIFYHIGLVFVHWPFHVKTAHPVMWVSVPLQAVNAWRLPLLFVVSGYASRAILSSDHRLGSFTWNRTKRLIPPLLFGVAVVVPVQPWIELTTQHGYGRSFLTFWASDYFRFGTLEGIVLPTWQHLWFVGYLWFYTAALAIVLAVLPMRARQAIERLVGLALSGPMILLLPTALLIGNWAWIYPGAPETHALVDDWPVHRVYFAMFLFGFLLRESDTVWRAIRRWWRWAAVIALASYAFIAAIEIAYLGPKGPPLPLWFWFGVARAAQSWGAVVALIGIADCYLNRDHPLRPMLTEAVFPFYLIHQTIIVFVAGELLALHLPPLAEFAIVVAATVSGCWLFYQLGREVGWLRPLIGLRSRATRPVAAI